MCGNETCSSCWNDEHRNKKRDKRKAEIDQSDSEMDQSDLEIDQSDAKSDPTDSSSDEVLKINNFFLFIHTTNLIFFAGLFWRESNMQRTKKKLI